MNPEALPDMQGWCRSQLDHKISDALARDDIRGVLEGLTLPCCAVGDLLAVIEPRGPDDRVVEVRCLDHTCRIAIWIKDALIALARNLSIDAHRTDEDQALHATTMHGFYDVLSLLLHLTGEIGIHYVLPRYYGLQRFQVQYVAFHYPLTFRIMHAEPLCSTKVQSQLCIAALQKKFSGNLRNLSICTKDQNFQRELHS